MKDINQQTDNLIETLSNNFVSALQTQIAREVADNVRARIAAIDISSMVRDYVAAHISHAPEKNLFPDRSISGRAINTDELEVSANNITSGIIKKFASTGIDDRATQCQLTVLDQGTVFENTLYAPRMHIKGDATIDGKLTILGQVPDDSELFQGVVKQATATVLSSIGPTLLDQYQDRVFAKIQEQGISINKLLVDGRVIFDQNGFSKAITQSNLERVGVLRDLQTQGETLLSETLYVGHRKVGVNTMDPAHALVS